MYFNNLQKEIERLWSTLENFHPTNEDRALIKKVWDLLDGGELSIVEKHASGYTINEWLKKAILLGFRAFANHFDASTKSYDKVPLKFANWRQVEFEDAKFRVVEGSVVRHSAHIKEGCIIMPSFINVGAHVGAGTMIDAWATVGSCAYVGKNCHISGGVGIGGVLEPLQANPVIIEDNVFIGARSEIVEGVIVGEGSVLSMGVYIGASTRIYNRATKETTYGHVPPFSVVVPGTLPSSDGTTHTYAAIIVKSVDAQTRAKVSPNELLREAKAA